jgi:hypothetical protein
MGELPESGAPLASRKEPVMRIKRGTLTATAVESGCESDCDTYCGFWGCEFWGKANTLNPSVNVKRDTATRTLRTKTSGLRIWESAYGPGGGIKKCQTESCYECQKWLRFASSGSTFRQARGSAGSSRKVQNPHSLRKQP